MDLAITSPAAPTDTAHMLRRTQETTAPCCNLDRWPKPAHIRHRFAAHSPRKPDAIAIPATPPQAPSRKAEMVRDHRHPDSRKPLIRSDHPGAPPATKKTTVHRSALDHPTLKAVHGPASTDFTLKHCTQACASFSNSVPKRRPTACGAADPEKISYTTSRRTSSTVAAFSGQPSPKQWNEPQSHCRETSDHSILTAHITAEPHDEQPETGALSSQ
jgi:hypothetical protein